MKQLSHIIYASAATHEVSSAELQALLATARANNLANGVTGMLLYCDLSFFQILEGPGTEIERVFTRIAADPRHHSITRIIKEPIPQRAFSEWSMAYAGTSKSDLQSIDGLNDFFIGATCLNQMDLGRSKKLLKAFSKGRWRQNLSGPVKPAHPSRSDDLGGCNAC